MDMQIDRQTNRQTYRRSLGHLLLILIIIATMVLWIQVQRQIDRQMDIEIDRKIHKLTDRQSALRHLLQTFIIIAEMILWIQVDRQTDKQTWRRTNLQTDSGLEHLLLLSQIIIAEMRNKVNRQTDRQSDRQTTPVSKHQHLGNNSNYLNLGCSCMEILAQRDKPVPNFVTNVSTLSNNPLPCSNAQSYQVNRFRQLTRWSRVCVSVHTSLLELLWLPSDSGSGLHKCLYSFRILHIF